MGLISENVHNQHMNNQTFPKFLTLEKLTGPAQTIASLSNA